MPPTLLYIFLYFFIYLFLFIYLFIYLFYIFVYLFSLIISLTFTAQPVSYKSEAIQSAHPSVIMLFIKASSANCCLIASCVISMTVTGFTWSYTIFLRFISQGLMKAEMTKAGMMKPGGDVSGLIREASLMYHNKWQLSLIYNTDCMQVACRQNATWP